MCADRVRRLAEAERPKAMGVDPYAEHREREEKRDSCGLNALIGVMASAEKRAFLAHERQEECKRAGFGHVPSTFTADQPPPSEFREKFKPHVWSAESEWESEP
jgi:hypothetical protein